MREERGLAIISSSHFLVQSTGTSQRQSKRRRAGYSPYSPYCGTTAYCSQTRTVPPPQHLEDRPPLCLLVPEYKDTGQDNSKSTPRWSIAMQWLCSMQQQTTSPGRRFRIMMCRECTISLPIWRTWWARWWWLSYGVLLCFDDVSLWGDSLNTVRNIWLYCKRYNFVLCVRKVPLQLLRNMFQSRLVRI